MKGGGSRLNVNIHKPRSALIRIENKVLPSAAPPNRRPRPPAPARRLLRFIHTPGMHRASRPACAAPSRPGTSAANFVSAVPAGPGEEAGGKCRALPPRGSRWGMAVPRASCLRRAVGKGKGGQERGGGCTWWPREGRGGGWGRRAGPGRAAAAAPSCRRARPSPPTRVPGPTRERRQSGRGGPAGGCTCPRENSGACPRPRAAGGGGGGNARSRRCGREPERPHPGPLLPAVPGAGELQRGPAGVGGRFSPSSRGRPGATARCGEPRPGRAGAGRRGAAGAESARSRGMLFVPKLRRWGGREKCLRDVGEKND